MGSMSFTNWGITVSKFIINRSVWKCANHGNGATALLNEYGFMCCLGQVSSQLGVTDGELLHRATPAMCDHTDKINILVHHDCQEYNSQLAVDAIALNDDATIDRKTREAKLQKLFKKNGYDLEFVGDYIDCVTEENNQ